MLIDFLGGISKAFACLVDDFCHAKVQSPSYRDECCCTYSKGDLGHQPLFYISPTLDLKKSPKMTRWE